MPFDDRTPAMLSSMAGGIAPPSTVPDGEIVAAAILRQDQRGLLSVRQGDDDLPVEFVLLAGHMDLRAVRQGPGCVDGAADRRRDEQNGDCAAADPRRNTSGDLKGKPRRLLECREAGQGAVRRHAECLSTHRNQARRGARVSGCEQQVDEVELCFAMLFATALELRNDLRIIGISGKGRRLNAGRSPTVFRPHSSA